MTPALPTLPGDGLRQIMWRFADRYDLQMAVQSARGIARGVAARLVADGLRKTHEWNERKAELLEAFDQSGLTSLYLDPEQGGFIEGPKNLATCLVAFELAWVDAGAATCSLASNLALAPIHERGTPEQRDYYMKKCAPSGSEEPWRGAFALTEPLPYVGVDTGVLSGKVRVAEWNDGGEPLLQVEKRGRFITNMCFANFVTAAVNSDDERIKGSCMVILEEGDEGTYDRGSPTLKMVHQLSSTRDPVLNLKVPASRIIGGYTVEDGAIVPRCNHSEIIAAVFHRTRIPCGLMTAAKLLSAVEPVIRYQRQRFRGGDACAPGSPRHELGLQQNEDALHRLIDVWAAGEAAASLGFAAAREADVFDPIERAKVKFFAGQGISGRKEIMALRKKQPEVLECLELEYMPEAERDAARYEALKKDIPAQFALGEARANILNPAAKLWDCGWGTTMMREAVTLMGGYGLTEDCPGFLPQKWTDAQLEATYEGPEAVQRRHLTLSMTSGIFQAEFGHWRTRMEQTAREHPGCGAGALAAGMRLWQWTYGFLKENKDANGKPLYHGKRQGATFPMADALGWLLASRYFLLDVLELKIKGPKHPSLAENLEAYAGFYTDLCFVQAARAAGETARLCAEAVYGYQRNPGADPALEKAVNKFADLRAETDAALAGSRLAKDRAALALTSVMIPEALDYPA